MPPTSWVHRHRIYLGNGEDSEPPGELEIGVDRPDATNTGLFPMGIDKNSLPNYTGPTTITLDNTIIEYKRIPFWLDIRAQNVIIRNNWCVGESVVPTSGKALIRCDNAAAVGVQIIHNLLEPQVHGNKVNGIQGHDFTARYNDIGHVVDGMGIRDPGAPNNQLLAVVEGNYIHDLTWFVEPGQSDGQTHNDGIQLEGGNGINSIIRGNFLDGRGYSPFSVGTLPDRGTGTEANGRYNWGAFVGIQFTDLPNDVYPINMTVTDNWIYGFKRGINAGSAAGYNIGTQWRNKFDDTQGERGSLSAYTGHTIDMDPQTTCNTGDGTANQNIYEATGNPVTVRRNQ